MNRRTTKTYVVCSILMTLLGDYRLSENSKVRKGAVLGWTAGQIALNTGLPERTVYRLLSEMCEIGIIEKRERQYRISSRILFNLYDYQKYFEQEKDRTLWLELKNPKKTNYK